MKIKNLIRELPIATAAVVVSVVFTVITAITGNRKVAVAEAIVIVLIVAFAFAYYAFFSKKRKNMVHRIFDSFDFADGKRHENFPLPVLVTEEDGKIIWHNHIFENIVLSNLDFSELEAIVESEIDVLRENGNTGINLKCGDKQFSVYAQVAKSGNLSLFFIDNTKLRLIAEKFMSTRPAVMLIAIDGMDDIERNYKDSESSAIRSGVENLIEVWLSDYDCMKTKRGENTFAVVTQTGDVESMSERKFDILDEVRSFTYNDQPLNITLSIGVGASGRLDQSEKQARQSLEMAFGRGGDQAAVKVGEEFEFFGGVSKSVERQTQVKTRIVSNAFCELLEGCDNVIIMGHKYPDLDALGSCFGVAAVARAYGKEAYIATDVATALSKPLIEYMSANGFGDYFVSCEEAEKKFRKKTLVVITDTHVKGFMECPELAEKATNLVVIDHHRKAVNFIDNTIIFYHDPSASSASELVTKMIQFLPKKIKIGSAIADALLSGIMLDTKNFVLRAGVSTFEAAAYLKGAGADTVRVKRLFSDTINEYKSRSEIISKAKIRNKCAVSVCEDKISEIRIVAAQAADELLNIKGVDASFVVFRTGENISISARSFGAVNVQLIMESLGGGGHQTMAAAQFKTEPMAEVYKKLIEAIDKYTGQ